MDDPPSSARFIIVDDFALPSRRSMVTAFRAARGIDTPIDRTGTHWRKGAAA